MASRGQYLSAKRLFKFVIQIRPDCASPHYNVELGAIEEAISHFKKATRIKPEIIKYRQFHKWYSMLFQCKYQNGQTPGGPKQDEQDDDDEKDDDKNDDEEHDEEEDDDKINCKNITDHNRFNEEYFGVNKNKINRWSIHELLREFCPNKFHLKRNATNSQKLEVLKKAINLYHPKNNSNSHQLYYQYNTKNHPDLNQKHLFQLLVHQKRALIQKMRLNKRKKNNKVNGRKHSDCPYCYAPIGVACEHKVKKKKNSKSVSSHKYYYYFEK